MLHQIQLEVTKLDDAKDFFEMEKEYDGIAIIQEKSFSGDITIIELYISAAINVLTIVGITLNALIKKKKVSTLIIDGERIEIKNVSEKLIERTITSKLNQNTQQTADDK